MISTYYWRQHDAVCRISIQQHKYTAFSDLNEETGIWGLCRTCQLLNNNYQSNKTVDIEKALSRDLCLVLNLLIYDYISYKNYYISSN